MQPLSLPNSVLYLLRKILKYNIVQKVANVNNFLHFFIEKSLIICLVLGILFFSLEYSVFLVSAHFLLIQKIIGNRNFFHFTVAVFHIF